MSLLQSETSHLCTWSFLFAHQMYRFLVFLVVWPIWMQSVVNSKHICDTLADSASSQLRVQSLTADRVNVYLIESDLLYTIPWTSMNSLTGQLSINSEEQPIRWDEAEWLKPAIGKLEQKPQLGPLHLSLFQMLPCTDKQYTNPIKHLVVHSGGQSQELYWHEKDNLTTLYYTVDPTNGDIPRQYHQITDGHRRSYVFTFARELKYYHSAVRHVSSSSVVLVPSRDSATEYWFSLYTNGDNSKLECILQGKPQLVPPHKSHKTHHKNEPFATALPFGLIHSDKVYLIDTLQNQVYIADYLDLSNYLKVLDLSQQPSRSWKMSLMTKRMDHFFSCHSSVRSRVANRAVDIEQTTKANNNTHTPLPPADDMKVIVTVFVLMLIYLLIVFILSYWYWHWYYRYKQINNKARTKQAITGRAHKVEHTDKRHNGKKNQSTTGQSSNSSGRADATTASTVNSTNTTSY